MLRDKTPREYRLTVRTEAGCEFTFPVDGEDASAIRDTLAKWGASGIKVDLPLPGVFPMEWLGWRGDRKVARITLVRL
jgi:hypothetical protein